MKIAYVFPRDAANPAVQSGRPASILAGLERLGIGIERVFPLASQPPRFATAKKILHRLAGRIHRADREAATLAGMAREIAGRMRGREVDAVFSPGSEAVSFLDSDRAITFCADATFANLVDYYWDFTRLSSDYLKQGHRQEAQALSRAALAVYPSEWAANTAIHYYGARPERVRVIPFGANLGADNSRRQVVEWIEGRGLDPLRLLFVGRHWQRKGGDLVVATARLLEAGGLRVRLDVVGCDIPARHRGIGWIHGHGLLSPRVPDEMDALSALFARAHFVFVPSRAEAYGMTFAEASAFGVPAVATATGGIPSIIRDGDNGRLLPLEAGAPDYAAAIAEAFTDSARYAAMAGRAFDAFESRLNWRSFCAQYVDALAALIGERAFSAEGEAA